MADSNGWQTQKRPAPPQSPSGSKKFALETSNLYDSLDRMDEDETIPTTPAAGTSTTVPIVSKPKIPPIFIPNVSDVNVMLKDIRKAVSDHEFRHKTLTNGEIKLQLNDTDSYRTLVKYLKSFVYSRQSLHEGYPGALE